MEASSSGSINMLMRAMAAGSAAGMTEHVFMFPIDTVKTRMQVEPRAAIPKQTTSFTALTQIVRTEGLARLYRGAPLVAVGAIPSHALYFGMYEATRTILGATRTRHQPIHTVVAAVAATMSHDIISTPIDVIKQRLQMKTSPLQSYWDGFLKIPLNQLFPSYPTAVMLNIPVVATNFVTYETLTLLTKTHITKESNMMHHLVCGGTAGGLAGFLSTPLDVVKTRIQTDCKCGKRPIRCVIREVTRQEGFFGLWAGYGARTIYHIPSAAITWSIYELMKKALGWKEDIPEHYMEVL